MARVGTDQAPGITSQIAVLHVDDEPSFAQTAAAFLERDHERIDVLTEPSASDGLARLADADIDCVVSDYEMPTIDGLEFLEAVREEHPKLPFILFTGKGSEELASEAISAGVTDYLQKDAGTEQYELLANRIENVVAQRRAQQRFSTLFESLPDGVVVVDAAGRIQQVNQRVEAIFGYDRETLIGEPVEVLVPDHLAEVHKAHRSDYIAQPETRPMGADIELYGVTAAGEELPVNISLSPVTISGDLNVIAVVRDLTAHKRHEQELKRQNERLDEFASIVSHDLRNPLTVAQGQLELAHEECDSPHLETAVDALDRSQVLIDDLLTLARQGDKVGAKEAVDLAALTERCWQTVETAEATLVTATDQTIRADASRLQQLLANLIQNAVTHGGDDVAITIGALDGGFYVADDGPGIAAAEREIVFESGYSTVADGTGFGLSIVEEIAEAHGWEVIATDSGAGGARFEVTGVETASG